MLKTFISKSFVSFVSAFCVILSSVFAGSLIPNDSLFERAGEFVTTPGRFKEYVVLKLDGSDEASRIQRSTAFRSEAAMVDRSKWRVFRQTPFQLNSFEFSNSPRGVLMINPQNHAVLSPDAVSESTWLEVAISPLRLGEALGLFDSDLTLPKLVDRLKKDSIQNKSGNKMEMEVKPEGLLIKTSGLYMHDKKTKVEIEATWEYLNAGKVSEADLMNSLTRSL